MGSSPRVWGQEPTALTKKAMIRIIPTRVGTRTLRRQTAGMHRDHPHACGDKVCENYYVGDGVGSSPRVWGQGFAVYHGQGQFRIIPTRVGTSYISALFPAFWQDHPHACGDKRFCTRFIDRFGGSSPRVWGQEW